MADDSTINFQNAAKQKSYVTRASVFKKKCFYLQLTNLGKRPFLLALGGRSWCVALGAKGADFSVGASLPEKIGNCLHFHLFLTL